MCPSTHAVVRQSFQRKLPKCTRAPAVSTMSAIGWRSGRETRVRFARSAGTLTPSCYEGRYNYGSHHRSTTYLLAAALTLASSLAVAQTSGGSSAGGHSTSGGPAATTPRSDTTQHTPSTGGASGTTGASGSSTSSMPSAKDTSTQGAETAGFAEKKGDANQALLDLIGGLAEIEVARLRGRSKRSRQGISSGLVERCLGRASLSFYPAQIKRECFGRAL